MMHVYCCVMCILVVTEFQNKLSPSPSIICQESRTRTFSKRTNNISIIVDLFCFQLEHCDSFNMYCILYGKKYLCFFFKI